MTPRPSARPRAEVLIVDLALDGEPSDNRPTAGMMEGTVIPAGLIVLIGPPGADKSTFADELVRCGTVDPGAVISSDAIAAEFFERHHPDDDGVIFGERDRRVLARLQRGQVAIADSTNVRPEARQRLIRLAREASVPVSALRFSVSLQTLRAQDAGSRKTRR